jgi:Fibronectin type III domain
MTVHVKNGDAGGGSWVTASDGDVHVKWGGTTWINPSFVKVKWGGGWLDSDYRGYPADPTGLAVNAWTYTSASVKWSAGSGGAAASTYEVQLRNQSGGVIQTSTDSSSPSITFSLSEQTKYQFYVRAKTASGLYSGWTGPLRIQTGRAATSTTTTEPAIRSWSKAANVNAWKDHPVGVVVPSTVVMKSIRYQLSANAGFTSVLSPYNNREIKLWLNNSDAYAVRNWLNPVDQTLPLNNAAIGGLNVQGFICRGSGWSSYSTGTQRVVGTVTVTGDENYDKVVTVTTPAIANSYW